MMHYLSIVLNVMFYVIDSFLSFMEDMFVFYYLIEIGSLVFQITVTLFAVVTVRIYDLC